MGSVLDMSAGEENLPFLMVVEWRKRVVGSGAAAGLGEADPRAVSCGGAGE